MDLPQKEVSFYHIYLLGAFGFKLESINQMIDVKSNDGKTNLMMHIIN
jgi:hypothetical protein